MSVAMRCSAYCVGERYNLNEISKYYRNDFICKIFGNEVMHVLQRAPGNDRSLDKNIFIYSYGCLVFWGFGVDEEEKILTDLREHGLLKSPLSRTKRVVDRCNYVCALEEDESYINAEQDEISLNNDDHIVKLAFSYGLSQSVKLSVFEDSVEKTIEDNKLIPHNLVRTGKIALSRKQLAKKIGELFEERNLVNLSSNVLDTPDFFWKRPKYEPYYEMAVKFMDIKQRIEILNGRLDIIHELYEMIATELQHSHSTRLELIVIFLIFIEIVIAFSRDILHWIT